MATRKFFLYNKEYYRETNEKPVTLPKSNANFWNSPIFDDMKSVQTKEISGITSRPQIEDNPFYECPNCRQKKISTITIQIRRGDEPATTFFSCRSCGHQWKQ